MEPSEPVNLTEALRSFDDVYSPRIVATMNDNDVRIAHTKGEIPRPRRQYDQSGPPVPIGRLVARTVGAWVA